MPMPIITSDALSRVYAAAYAAPNGLAGGNGANVARQGAAEKAVMHFAKTLDEQLGYKTVSDD